MTKTKTKITKRVLCVMLCLVTAFCTLPMSASAFTRKETTLPHSCDGTERSLDEDLILLGQLPATNEHPYLLIYYCKYCGDLCAVYSSTLSRSRSASKSNDYTYINGHKVTYAVYSCVNISNGSSTTKSYEILTYQPFSDVTYSEYKNYCKYLEYTSYYNSYIKGVYSYTADNGNVHSMDSSATVGWLRPEEKLTVSAAITILYKMAGSPSVSGSNPFKDVSTSDSYYKAALWAYKKGITTSTTFNGSEAITRERLITFAYRFVTKVLGESVTTKSISSFSDASSVSSWAKTAMKWAYANGVMSGSNGKLNPAGTITRIVSTKIYYKMGTTYNIGNQTNSCSHDYNWQYFDQYYYGALICSECGDIKYISGLSYSSNFEYKAYTCIYNNYISPLTVNDSVYYNSSGASSTNSYSLWGTKGMLWGDIYSTYTSSIDNYTTTYFIPTTYRTILSALYAMSDYPYDDDTILTEDYAVDSIMTWATQNNITTTSSTNYDNAITRQQAVTLLYRYVTKVLGESVTTKSISSFSDASSVSSYAETAMKWAYANGIISGSNGKLNPKGTCSLTALTKMLYKMGTTYNIGNNSGTSYLITQYYNIDTGETVSQNILF